MKVFYKTSMQRLKEMVLFSNWKFSINIHKSYNERVKHGSFKDTKYIPDPDPKETKAS